MHGHSAAALLPLLFLLTAASPAELARWKAQAQTVTITRDDWGIAHVRGRTDADAVFGMIYAQAEDDFPRIEANYLTALGRKAEAEGEKAIWEDLRARLYVSEAELKAHYARSPEPMRRLMDVWAAGLNYYLATHPNVRPRVLKRFEPWMALSFTEGSIGGDIERIDLKELERFYSSMSSSPRVRGEAAAAGAADGGAPPPHFVRSPSPANAGEDKERQGSNGIAIAPSLTQARRSLLLINPHTSFFFRSEQQMTSDEGLNVYGAATWGQFFIYQGFNEHAGWMHTSSGVDAVDEFTETIEGRGKARCYRYGSSCRPIGIRPITIRYRTSDGRMASRSFNTYFTHHGPVVRSDNGRWVTFAMMNRPVEALQQSFLRTKARDFESFLRVAQLKANSSNNTIFADSRGTIAYLHPHFVPRRDNRFDYTKPVDGSDPATDWGSLHALSELPNVVNPPTGWVQNTNTWPYRAAGEFSANPVRFPRYMDMFGENFRGLHALQLLMRSRGWTIDRLQAAAFDSYQPGFATLVPMLVKAYDDLPKADARRAQLAEPIAALRGWNYRWSADSIPQAVAAQWVDLLMKALNDPEDIPANIRTFRLARHTTAAQKLQALADAVASLHSSFGRWQVPWGEINRFQRISPAIKPTFSDDAPSIAVPFTNGRWGSLASIRSEPRPGTRRWYADYGNTFVAVVEFGPRVRARAIREGGQSGDPKSPHFNDQAQRYASGALREVYFYPDQLKGHTERVYRPGE
jgi:acyl-homoserine-lactone acylase